MIAVALAWAGTSRADPCGRIPVWRDGRRIGDVCRSDVAARRLTVIDLGDDWVPPMLDPGPDDSGPSYRRTYLALAQERFDEAGLEGELAFKDRYLELFGIEPTLTVVRGRLANRARHHCHEAVDNTELARLPPRMVEESRAEARERLERVNRLDAELEFDRARKHLPDLEALAASDPYYRRQLDRLDAEDRYLAIVRAVQAHLACDFLFEFAPIEGAYTWQTSNAIETFQRGAMILPTGIFDEQTRDALVLDSRERDFRTALRVLRERVIAATGLIEDGSAGVGESRVLDRSLDPETLWRVRGYEPVDNAAPDLVSAATESAARALGWRDPDSTLAFLVEGFSREVAIALPPSPAYHTDGSAISVEIDRGDVYYGATPRWHDAARRPALTLYITVRDRRIPLVRWPTTIGGWQNEKQDTGDITKQWKESPVGHRVWRDVLVGPTWLPPKTTPDRELVHASDDEYVLAREVFGPSYRAAFGMVAFPHLAEERAHGKIVFDYQDVLTHGTGKLASVAHGVSHGCHRLVGLQAVRLADFVLAHDEHTHRGDQPTYYRRIVELGGRFPVTIDSLGYRIELASPIPVDVLPGRIHRP